MGTTGTSFSGVGRGLRRTQDGVCEAAKFAKKSPIGALDGAVSSGSAPRTRLHRVGLHWEIYWECS